MKVRELLAHLGNLPKDALDQEVVLVIDDNIRLTSPEFGYAAEPFYWNCDYGIVDETRAKECIAEVEPEFELSMKDFEVMYPKGTVFISAAPLPKPEQPKTKADLVKDSIDEGSIPHLKAEFE